MKKKRVAIVYDWVDKWGGVERLLLILHKMYPKAPLYTSFYDEKNAKWAKDIKIKTSFMQLLPSFFKRNRILSLPFFLFAFQSFNFSKYESVISVSSAFAKNIRVEKNTKHIAIILTPPRYLWSHVKDHFPVTIIRMMVTPLIALLRFLDRSSSQKPNEIFAISKLVQSRVKKFYKRESELLYPPFDNDYWNKIRTRIKKKNWKFRRQALHFLPKKKYYLVVARLEKYKKIDLVIKTFNALNLPLVIVGKGTQEKRLKSLANTTILFIKDLSDEELGYVYINARALIMPQEEDFGYTSLEAQSFGCPVISYKKSGAAETIQHKKTGYIFEKQTTNSLANAIERYTRLTYNDRHESDYLRRGGWYKTLATFKKKVSQAVRKNHRRTIHPSTYRRPLNTRV